MPPRSPEALRDQLGRALVLGMGLSAVGLGLLLVVWEPLGGVGPQRYVVGSITTAGGILLVGMGLGRFWWPSLYGSPAPGSPEYESAVRQLRWLFWTVGTAAPVVGVLAIVYLLTR